MPQEVTRRHEVYDDTDRPLDLRASRWLAVGQKVFVPFTVADARDLGQIQLVASDGRVFNASIGCLEATALLPDYEQMKEVAADDQAQEPPGAGAPLGSDDRGHQAP